MSILKRYILKSSILPFFMGFGGFLLYANVFILIDISSEIVRNDLSFWKLFPYIMQQIPRYIPQAIPVGVLLSIFWLLSKLESKNEIIAFQVHGIKLKEIVTPFLILGIILSLTTYVLKEHVVPEMYRNKNAEVYLSSGLHKFMLSEENRYMFIKRIYSNRKELVDVFIYDIDKENTSMKVYYAPQVLYDEEQSEWDLSGMKVYASIYDSKMIPHDLNETDRKLVGDDIDFYFMVTRKKAYNMKSDELLQIMNEFKRRGIYNTDSFSFDIEFHTRYAQSLGPLVVAILGVPLSLALNIKSKAWSVIFTFLLIALYQGSTQWMAAMGRSDLWSPWHIRPELAAWGPDLLFSVIGGIFYMLLDTEMLYGFKEKLSRFSGE
ncbi:MAG TPA: LptF/LptG family permease [Thermotogota bacterium]|nr:LptF/LptG family permease [Thermotogota bacterium]HPJ89003.1 LptF/LptG family permease [Thermotogota bacterium]HPR95514.1 LptF/LptG family permease [Thermotogota bacterium]